ncbi:MAG: Por secretion system protein [Prevotella sp.]|nr:Por secretion system protein [Prevotella sp.]
MEIKNHISHRARATQKLADYLLKLCILLFTIHCSLFTASAQVGTWKNDLAYNHVEQIYASGDDIFVRASNGLYLYNKKDQSITTFDRVNGLSDTNIKLIGWSKQAKRLIAVYQNSNIDLVETNGNIINISSLYSKTMTEDKTVNNVFVNGIYAYLSTGFGIVKVNMQKAEITETYHFGKNITATSIKNNTIYAKINDSSVISAPISSNLLDPNNWTPTEDYPYDTFIFDQTDWETYYDLIASLSPGGPKYNLFGYMRYVDGKLITSDNSNSDVVNAAIQVLKNNEWQSFETETVYEKIGRSFVNVYAVDVDPYDDTHYFAGARCGLFEFRNGAFVKHYNSENSPIEAYNGKSLNRQMITGVKYDHSGNLWLLNSSAPTRSIIKYTKDGEFVTYDVPEVMKLNQGEFTNRSNSNMSNIIFDSKGYMWFVNNNWTRPAAYRYDMNNNACIEYYNFINQDGTAIIGMNGVSCVAEDKDGNMWIGTDVGPFLLEKSQIEANNPIYTQVKVPRNDGTNYADYLLNKVNITAIAIDAGNRKWMGTNGNGVYLISADNITQLQHFTTDNSELLSNIIYSITINEKTGEVLFGTDNGLCSYISDATDINPEMVKDNVWAYPNPVTPDYNGLITVVGLTFNADVKVLSSNGTLIAEGRSNGGSYIWDGKDKNGNRVASGVYMVVTATSDGKKGTVCKIAVLN